MQVWPFTLDGLFAEAGFTPNDAQRQAIGHTDRPLFLVAGPGSGKAWVLLWRTASFIHRTNTRRPSAPERRPMNALRLVYYVIDPYIDERTLIAALISQAGAVQVLRVPAPRLAQDARANVERILRDLEATHVLDPLPFGVGAQVVAGPVTLLPSTLTEAPAWVREVLLRSAA